ncbi:hypothetical protein JCM8097_000562 [Rhodosporidiobolus ruineniae]
MPSLLGVFLAAFLVASSVLATPVLAARRLRTCIPAFEEGAVYNVFAAGKADETWEYVPPASNLAATTGGAFFLSEGDAPESGGFYITSVEGEESGTFTLSVNEQCLRTIGKNRALTSGPCALVKSTFTLSCTSCPSSSSPPTAGTPVGRACTLTSRASPGYCVASVSPSSSSSSVPSGNGSRGLGGLEARKCQTRARAQSWDLVRA